MSQFVQRLPPSWGRVNAHDSGHVLVNAELPSDGQRDRYFKWLTDYLRTRMVFVAEASRSDPNSPMTLPLMRQVITPFSFLPRGNESEPISESPVCRHIAQSEGVAAVTIRAVHNAADVNDADDIPVLIPGGVVGTHALYCILENVIRNGAKYGQKREGEPLLCSLLIEDATLAEDGSDWASLTAREDLA